MYLHTTSLLIHKFFQDVPNWIIQRVKSGECGAYSLAMMTWGATFGRKCWVALARCDGAMPRNHWLDKDSGNQVSLHLSQYILQITNAVTKICTHRKRHPYTTLLTERIYSPLMDAQSSNEANSGRFYGYYRNLSSPSSLDSCNGMWNCAVVTSIVTRCQAASI